MGERVDLPCVSAFAKPLPAALARDRSPRTPPAELRHSRSNFPMPATPLTPRELVDRLDARHEELIARLDELNSQIEAALAEFGRSRQAPPAESAIAKAA
jgi:hypothetical protein